MSAPLQFLDQYQIDAFTDQLFGGNPAAVLVLERFLDVNLMQSIAMENNLSETAFIVPTPSQKTGHYDIRWFTPSAEIDFCGHATLASAHALFAQLKAPLAPDDAYHFHGQIGALRVTASQEGGAAQYGLVAPIFNAHITPLTPAMQAAFPMPLLTAFIAADNLYIVAKSAQDVEQYSPDFAAIGPLSSHGVGLTAAGGRDSCKDAAHCTSRFFVPELGIDEDPVTGSAHCAIGPYWAAQLGLNSLRAYQASPRGGWLDIKIGKDKVTLTGRAVTFSKGQIYLPA